LALGLTIQFEFEIKFNKHHD